MAVRDVCVRNVEMVVGSFIRFLLVAFENENWKGSVLAPISFVGARL